MVKVFKKPEEVFTPRSSEVNTRMYIARPDLEEGLARAVKVDKHILIHGESGSGKSWLYKKVFAASGIRYLLANLANASRLKSITKEIENVLSKELPEVATGYSEKKSAKISAVVAEADIEHEKQVSIRPRDAFEECLAQVRKLAGDGKTAVLVLDNLETIFSSADLMNELADLIILLDDSRYARYGVRLLLVGVPGDVREYFNKTPNRSSVANRLQELNEVSRLPDMAAAILVHRGFVEELGYSFEAGVLELLKTRAAWVTDRIPQRLHEYCLAVAQLAETRGRIVSKAVVNDAEWEWLSSSLTNVYNKIEGAMNVKETKVGRRNQTLFALGSIQLADFRASDIEEMVRDHFPRSTENKTLNISGMLADLAAPEIGVLKRSPKGDGFMFCDPRYRMCIRAMLQKVEETEEVVKVQHSG